MLLYILVGVFLVIVIAAKLFLTLKGKEEVVSEIVYESRGRLMTNAESVFFHALKSALPVGHYHIHSKVRMADLVDVKKGIDRKQWRSAFNKIDSKHVDFVLSNPVDSTIYAVIELDDKSHQRASRKKSDEFKNATFGSCGIPVIRIPVRASYTVDEIIGHVNQAFGR